MKILDVPQSGSIAGQTSSRNPFGQYRRTRAIPVNPGSTAQAAARARLATNAVGWRSLTQPQREGWAALGSEMTRTDSLGQVYTLSGFLAYLSVNGNRLAAGDAAVSDAPALSTPDPLTSLTLDLEDTALEVAFTPTPLGAGERAFIFMSPQRSVGRQYESDFRLISVTAAAGTSPQDPLAAYTARFGAPVVGNRIFVQVQRYALGFLSAPLTSSGIVV